MNTEYLKVYVFIPKGDAEKVRLAIGDAGIGKIGNYNHCSFITEGRGYFLPLDGANPTIGLVSKPEEVEEVKLEFICEKTQLETVFEILKKVHPYEEIAIDVVPLLGSPSISKEK